MYRIAGALLIIIGSYIIGQTKQATDRKVIRTTGELIKAINIMICELEFHRTPFPALCAFVSENTEGEVSLYFSELEKEASVLDLPNIKTCSDLVIERLSDIPACTKGLLSLLGESVGYFGAEGQIAQLKYVKNTAEVTLENNIKRFETFGRSYQTLWICAGIALAVIMI